MGLKVAIVGLSESSRHLVPWDDPEWHLWGLGWDAERYSFHRTFEMHDMTDLEKIYGVALPSYLEKLRECSGLTTAENFPFDAVAEDVGDYWTSSVGYMLSLAIHKKPEEIAVYGVDANDEYGYQKPNLEYLIGFARGRGIEVNIPEQSPLCKFVSPPGRDYAGRYGKTK